MNDLGKRFGGVQALQGVSFTVQDGDVLGIIGPNGAGKTTLLNCVSGLFRPDRGDIRWQDRSIVGQPPYRIARLASGGPSRSSVPFLR